MVAIRPHLVWGPGDTQLIARIVARGRAGRLPLIGPGAVLVDTTYVDNAVDALVAALDRAPAAHGQALVVTNGEPRPIARAARIDLRGGRRARSAPAGPARAGRRPAAWSRRGSGACGSAGGRARTTRR